ncbi:hypothetical protein Scep_018103 [Stephania cephalantha]|uniref:Thymidylate kinase n=1 Tax=Stephania cephalantha TaxID=152367 RepID=A0AAP0NW94_9MAGN
MHLMLTLVCPYLVEKFGSIATSKLVKPFLNFPRNRTFRETQMESNENNNVRGALIVLEGLDRSGKTSQCSRLHSCLAE